MRRRKVGATMDDTTRRADAPEATGASVDGAATTVCTDPIIAQPPAGVKGPLKPSPADVAEQGKGQ